MKNEAAKEMRNKTISGALAGGNNIISFSLFYVSIHMHRVTDTHTYSNEYQVQIIPFSIFVRVCVVMDGYIYNCTFYL